MTTPPSTQKPRYFSKSQYTRYQQCAKSLWLYRKRNDLQDPVSPDQQAIFDQGTAVGVLAQQWRPGGVLIKADHTDPERALEETRGAIAAGAKVLYEAAFLYEGVLVRVDVMARNPEGGWDFWEVKSTTKIEDYHLLDAAVQKWVLRGAGVAVGVAHVVHVNSAYVRAGALDLSAFFVAVNVNAETSILLANVPGHLVAMKAQDQLAEAPAAAIGPHCTKPHDCSFLGHCWAHVPDYSVFNLAGARAVKTTELWHQGYQRITDIPDCTCKPTAKKCTCGYRLTDYQALQRIVARSGQPFIHAAGIRELLNQLRYPLYFLDFEAVNPAVPQYDGCRPYQPLPFEASLHVQAAPGASVTHLEYLADGTLDPRPGLRAFLCERIGPVGSLVAYNKSYEGGILKALAQMAPQAMAEVLLDQERRLWDLADPFRKALYAHPRFEGSWSIKKVLPVLVPDLSYAGLAIQDGAAAMRAYTRLMTEALSPEERAQIMADLRAYCGQDTYAMVRLLDHLEALTAATPQEA